MKNLKQFISTNRLILLTLGFLLLITYGIFIFFIFNSSMSAINDIFKSNYNYLQQSINGVKDYLVKVSQLSPESLTKYLQGENKIYSWQTLNKSGEVIYSYPDKGMIGLSLKNNNIFEKANKTGKIQMQILPSNSYNDKSVLVFVFPGENGFNLVFYSFASLLENINVHNELTVNSDHQGNIIVTNIEEDIYSKMNIYINESKENILFSSTYIKTKSILESPIKIIFMYNLEDIITKVGLISILIIGIIILVFWIFFYIRKNFTKVTEDLMSLERKSNQLLKTINYSKNYLDRPERFVKPFSKLGDSLIIENPYTEEMNFVFRSYKELVGELLRLIEEITHRNEKISSMNREISKSYAEINSYQDKILLIIELLSNINPDKSLSSFMKDILELSISLIPAADGGCAGIITNESFKFIAQSGFSENLKEIKLPKNFVMMTEKAVIFNDLKEYHGKNYSEEYKKILRDVSIKKIKSSLAIGLKTNDIMGNLFLNSFDKGNNFTANDKKIIEAIAKLSSTFVYLKILLKEEKDTYFGMIRALSKAVELKDKYTRGHSERVARYSIKLGEALGLGDERKLKLKEAALLHDIGKIGIVDDILNKPCPLTDQEYEQIKKHTIYGEKILKNVYNLQEIAKIVRAHHERWDGLGYPDRLKGTEIPLESRIIALFDAFDTILTTRSYKGALPYKWAIEEIKNNAGTQFDPKLVEVFLEITSQDWVVA